MKRQLVEDEIEAKRWAWELREVDLKQREDVVEKDIELKRALLLKEREDINKTMLDLQKSLDSLQVRRKQVDCAKEKLQTMISETNELAALEMKLKEEVDTLRAYKLGLMIEEDRLKFEKDKFEIEWELIDEKRRAKEGS
jgi:hypothetical protein